MLSVGGAFTSPAPDAESQLKVLLLVSFSVTCVLPVGYFVYLLVQKLRVRKPYSHFLSHSRVELVVTLVACQRIRQRIPDFRGSFAH